MARHGGLTSRRESRISLRWGSAARRRGTPLPIGRRTRTPICTAGQNGHEDALALTRVEEQTAHMKTVRYLDELEENLRDIYNELTSGNIPGVRRLAELQVP